MSRPSLKLLGVVGFEQREQASAALFVLTYETFVSQSLLSYEQIEDVIKQLENVC